MASRKGKDQVPHTSCNRFCKKTPKSTQNKGIPSRHCIEPAHTLASATAMRLWNASRSGLLLHIVLRWAGHVLTLQSIVTTYNGCIKCVHEGGKIQARGACHFLHRQACLVYETAAGHSCTCGTPAHESSQHPRGLPESRVGRSQSTASPTVPAVHNHPRIIMNVWHTMIAAHSTTQEKNAVMDSSPLQIRQQSYLNYWKDVCWHSMQTSGQNMHKVVVLGCDGWLSGATKYGMQQQRSHSSQ